MLTCQSLFDRGYLDYDRSCSLKECDEDVICLRLNGHALTSWNASQTPKLPTNRGHDTSAMIGLLAETTEEFRRIVFVRMAKAKSQVTGTTLSSGYIPVKLSLRWYASVFG